MLSPRSASSHESFSRRPWLVTCSSPRVGELPQSIETPDAGSIPLPHSPVAHWPFVPRYIQPLCVSSVVSLCRRGLPSPPPCFLMRSQPQRHDGTTPDVSLALKSVPSADHSAPSPESVCIRVHLWFSSAFSLSAFPPRTSASSAVSLFSLATRRPNPGLKGSLLTGLLVASCGGCLSFC